MKHDIKIAILGGSGKSGKYLVRQLLAQGYSCKLLLRNPENFTIKSPWVETIRGDARNEQDIFSLIKDCKAVISTLGQPKGEAPIFSKTTQNIIQAMQNIGAKRYILTAGLNVDTPEDKKSEKTQMATAWMQANFPEISADRQAEFRLLSESKLDWTMVRLPMIEQTEGRSKVLVSLDDCPGEKISTTNLAHFLIEQLSDDGFVRKAPFIANG
ncbi:NAD(P)H-binding protein [Catalinimonas sp. 4WD22]|uniref:NAD(P)-dependent oxidoreductase n=1 Tax=Catalinimonas locisalis TaxID=3133978 RepID=UPI003100B239